MHKIQYIQYIGLINTIKGLKQINNQNCLKDTTKVFFAIVIRCSRLRFEQVILSILKLYLCSFNGCFKQMFFNSVKEINSLRKVINSLLRKGMWMFYNGCSLLTFFWGAPTQADIIAFPNFLLYLKNQRSGSKTVCDLSTILILKGIMTF